MFSKITALHFNTHFVYFISQFRLKFKSRKHVYTTRTKTEPLSLACELTCCHRLQNMTPILTIAITALRKHVVVIAIVRAMLKLYSSSKLPP